MIKAIIFDYDGVIVDSFKSAFEAYKIICAKFEVACPKEIEEFRKIYGLNYIECYQNLGIPKEGYAEANIIFKNVMIKSDHGMFDGILEVIENLAKKYKLYLATASHSDEVLVKLKKFNLEHCFEKIYCGADQNIRKDSMIKDLLESNKYTLNEVISIGDRAIDYEVAKKVGIKDDNIILVTYGWGLDKYRIGKAKIVDNPEDILIY
jgi:phosphoglycolate phosphatase